MRLFVATLISLAVCSIFFLIIKIWGSSQPYIEYKHPFYADETQTMVFKIVRPQDIEKVLTVEKNIYLNIAVTRDQKLILIDRSYENEKQIKENKTFKYQNKNFDEITSENPQAAVILQDYKELLQNKRIIFNMQDNPLQGTPVFLNTMKTLGFESGHNFIFVSPYEPPAKDLKSVQPTFLFGASHPEILRIKALESIFLIEAATFRADVVIHPLTYYKKPFFTEALVNNLGNRFKRFIIGPLQEVELAQAMKLNPLGVIVD